MIAALSLLLLAACVPRSMHPLSDPELARVDTRLVGLWSARIEEDDVYLHFVPRADGWTEVVSVSYNTDRAGGDWLVFRMVATRIDGRDFMSLKFIAEANERAHSEFFHLARYRLSRDGELTIWTMPQEAAAKAIQAGLAGKIRKGRFGDDVLLTATTTDLASYLSRAGDGSLFSNRLAVFRRVHNGGAVR